MERCCEMDTDIEVALLAAAAVDTEQAPLVGASDFRGRPVYRNTSGGWRAGLFSVVLEIACTLAKCGISANLITFMTGPLGHSNASAATAVNVWSGTTSLTPLLGAFVADSWLGRYRTIILGSTLYILGYGMITLSSTLLVQPPIPTLVKDSSSAPPPVQLLLFYASLYLVAIAHGLDKPCALAFAADQFDQDYPRECRARKSFFNWWYFSASIGIVLAVTVFSYIQENVGWGIGFGMLCAIVLCSFLVFLLGSPTYRFCASTVETESPFTRLARSLAALVKNKNYPFSSNMHQQEVHYAVAVSGEARGMLRLLPIWAAFLGYGVVSAQVTTFFNKQGRTLDRRIFATLELPPAALLTFGPVSNLVFIPVYDRVLVPALSYATGHPSGLTQLQRVGTGMAVSLAAVCTAALVEGRRLETARQHGLVDDPGATVPMSWMWLVPQYVMMGVGDVLAGVGMQEFFYDQMPKDLRSLGLALFFSVIGIGGFISGALISFIHRITSRNGSYGWFAENLNQAHLDYFYWLLASLSVVGLMLFIHFARSYVYSQKMLSCSK